MTSLILIASILSASGSAVRTVDSPDSIAATVLRMSIGAVSRSAGEGVGDGISKLARGGTNHSVFRVSPKVAVDGIQATGLTGYARAITRIIGYITDINSTGSVRFSGQRYVRGKYVVWSVLIQDGQLVISGEAWNVQRLDHVRLEIRATEARDESTVVTGVAGGYTSIGSRCRLVCRIAEREINKGLSEALRRVEVGGRHLYSQGDPTAAFGRFLDCLEQGSR